MCAHLDCRDVCTWSWTQWAQHLQYTQHSMGHGLKVCMYYMYIKCFVLSPCVYILMYYMHARTHTNTHTHTHTHSCVHTHIITYTCVYALLGRLITAKYIAPERYHKWFPAAENAVRTIYPSDTWSPSSPPPLLLCVVIIWILVRTHERVIV